MAPNNPISMKVSIADPDSTAHALKPNSDGSMNVGTTAGFSATNITTAATTLVKTGAGVVHIVNVNSKGTVASLVKVYDGIDAGGTLLATIDSLNLSGPNVFDIAFVVGLTIVTTGTVAPNVTVSWR